MVLVDTSLWVPTVRRGAPAGERREVSTLLHAGEAAWCAPVRLELWAGIGGEEERRNLAALTTLVHELPISGAVWEEAIRLASAGRQKGWTFPFADLLIFACAKEHKVKLLHRDKHFDRLAKF